MLRIATLTSLVRLQLRLLLRVKTRKSRSEQMFSGYVKVFGCRPHDDGARYSVGRRTKTSKGGNREIGGCGDSARAPRASAPRALWGFGGDGSSGWVRAERSTASVGEVGAQE